MSGLYTARDDDDDLSLLDAEDLDQSQSVALMAPAKRGDHIPSVLPVASSF